MHDDSSTPPSALNRRQFFAAFTAAMAAAGAASAHAQTPAATITPDAVAKTHEALFDLWFPLSAFGLPPAVEQTIGTITTGVNSG
ncbi:MAG TPA: hypothetical protein VNP95_07420, partial [Thermomicrobiales bacterium]|nr:hypothetical protein [Thermomicrobiales bacterium]